MRGLVFLISFFCFSLISYSSDYINIFFGRANYKAADKNWSIAKDNIGRIYFANDAGLLEYDGIEWKLHKLKDNSVVRSVFVDDNHVYSGSFEQFGIWDRNSDGELFYTSLSDSLEDDIFRNDDVWKILKFDNNIYFQSFHGLYVYDGFDAKRIEGLNVFSVFIVENDLIVQEIDGALYRVLNEKYVKIEGSDFLSTYKVQALLATNNRDMLVITSKGDFFIYDGQLFSPMSVPAVLKNKEINNVQVDLQGNYCIGTLLDGIFIISKQGEIISHLNTQNLLSNNSVLSTFIDEKNNIWGGLAEGIVLLKYSSDLDFYIDYKNDVGSVYAACVYSDKLFIGTNLGLFYTKYSNVFSSDFSLSQFEKIESIQEQVWDLAVVDNKVYCAHNGGLTTLDEKMQVTSPFPLNTGVFSMLKLADSADILLGTYTDLSKVNYKSNELVHFNTLREPIKDIEIDHLGNVWLEHLNRGVYKCQMNEMLDSINNIVYYNSRTNEDLPYKLNMFKVGERIAFLGNDQFYIYDDILNTIIPLEQVNLLFEDKTNLKNVINSGRNNFWVLSNNALYELYTNGAETDFRNKIDLEINDLSLVNNFETIVPLNDSVDLICLNKGFILYNNKKNYSFKHSRIKPIITVFESIDENNILKSKDMHEQILMPYNENSIKISFFSPESLDQYLLVQYCLEGFEDWSEPALSNHVLYDRLPNGKYTFAVRTINSLGDISESTTINFEINKHWTRMWWAYLLYLVLVIILTWTIHRYVLIRYRNAHLLKVRERELSRLKTVNSKLQMEMREKDAEMLSQTSSIIQKNELIHQVKEELNSYQEKISSNSFKPLYNKINLLLNLSLNSEEDWTNFMFKFELRHPTFFKYLKINYPQLTANDLKLCACLKLNLDSKEIASLMNLSVRSVENNRSRLRKKFGLEPQQNLNEFIMSI